MVVSGDMESSQAVSPILHPHSRSLFRLWEAMRGEASAPRKDELDLKQIGALVPDLFILERAQEFYRWRLAGTRVCELFRRDPVGEQIFGSWVGFERETVCRLLDGVTEALQPAIMRIRLHTSQGQAIGAEIIALPLLPATGCIQVLGGLFPFCDVHSCRYDAITGEELASARVIWTQPIPGDNLAPNFGYRPFQLIAGGLS